MAHAPAARQAAALIRAVAFVALARQATPPAFGVFAAAVSIHAPAPARPEFGPKGHAVRAGAADADAIGRAFGLSPGFSPTAALLAAHRRVPHLARAGLHAAAASLVRRATGYAIAAIRRATAGAAATTVATMAGPGRFRLAAPEPSDRADLAPGGASGRSGRTLGAAPLRHPLAGESSLAVGPRRQADRIGALA
jgi:hypothetical protein